MFFREKKLYDRDPKTLNTELLITLEKALIAKLLLVTDELRVRAERLAKESKGLPDSGENEAFFEHNAKRYRGFGLMLENVLAQELGKAPGLIPPL